MMLHSSSIFANFDATSSGSTQTIPVFEQTTRLYVTRQLRRSTPSARADGQTEAASGAVYQTVGVGRPHSALAAMARSARRPAVRRAAPGAQESSGAFEVA